MHCIEFQGRLGRAEGRPASAGSYDLFFRLYTAADDEDPLWEEHVPGVNVQSGGHYQVLLGRTKPMDPRFFEKGPCVIGVSVVKNGRVGEEAAERSLVLGGAMQVAAELADTEAELGALLLRMRRRVKKLWGKVGSLEGGGGPLTGMLERLGALEARLGSLEGEEGRLTKIEDELEDLIGSEGDIIDIYERIERLEGKGPSPRRLEMDDNPRMADLHRRLIAVEDKLTGMPEVLAETVKKGGDTMNGALTISKGGLHITSGGLHARGAEVNSLEASVQVKTGKLIVDAIELRGDLTVDNTQRTLQVRALEGRSGGSRKDGVLALNTRSGAEVVIGKTGDSDGLRVHGTVRGEQLESRGHGLAQAFEPGDRLAAGEVAVLREDGKVGRSAGGDATVIGVVVENAGLVTGVRSESAVLVAVAGVVRCKVEGRVAAGDRLEGGSAGLARKATGAVSLGRALAGCGPGGGELWVLLG